MQNETLFQQLMNGNLPEVEVVATVDDATIVKLAIAIVVVFALCVGLFKIAN